MVYAEPGAALIPLSSLGAAPLACRWLTPTNYDLPRFSLLLLRHQPQGAPRRTQYFQSEKGPQSDVHLFLSFLFLCSSSFLGYTIIWVSSCTFLHLIQCAPFHSKKYKVMCTSMFSILFLRRNLSHKKWTHSQSPSPHLRSATRSHHPNVFQIRYSVHWAVMFDVIISR